MLLPQRKVIKIGAHYSCRSIWAIAQLKEVESWDQIHAARLHPSHDKFLHPCPASVHSHTFPSIVSSFPAPVYFYHFPYLVPWCGLSLCLHPSASDAYLCPAFGPVAVGSADLRCWPKPCVFPRGPACVYVGLPTCIYVCGRKTSCRAVTWMLVSAVPGVHSRLLLIRYLKLFGFFFCKGLYVYSVALDQWVGRADMLADIETRICSEEMLEVFQIILKQRCLHSLSTREDRGVTFSRSLFWVATNAAVKYSDVTKYILVLKYSLVLIFNLRISVFHYFILSLTFWGQILCFYSTIGNQVLTLILIINQDDTWSAHSIKYTHTCKYT